MVHISKPSKGKASVGNGDDANRSSKDKGSDGGRHDNNLCPPYQSSTSDGTHRSSKPKGSEGGRHDINSYPPPPYRSQASTSVDGHIDDTDDPARDIVYHGYYGLHGFHGENRVNEYHRHREPFKYLIWGGGWISSHLGRFLFSQRKPFTTTVANMEDRLAVYTELRKYAPRHVLLAAGVTGRPNVDWCEDNKENTIRSNIVGVLNVVDCCFLLGIHCTVYSSGCIYEYDDKHPVGGPGFTEEDPPNFGGSFYSQTKALTEQMLKNYSNCLILRLRMPVSDDLHPRSFLTKILGYERVVTVPNSHTILSDLLPISVFLAESRETGIYNLTSPGVISHNEVLNLFKRLVRPSLTWTNMTLDEQAKILKAGRSNCALDTTKLEKKVAEYGIRIPNIREAYARVFKNMAADGIQ